jgi:parvulin-like peptidyl-prolyl isomerase
MKTLNGFMMGWSPRRLATYTTAFVGVATFTIGLAPLDANAQGKGQPATGAAKGKQELGSQSFLKNKGGADNAPPAKSAPIKGGPQGQGAPNKADAGNANKSATKPIAKDQKVMAVVNSEPIERTQLGNECIDRYGAEVLESLVNRKLIGQACDEAGIKITEEEVDEEVRRTASRFNLPVDKWLMMLKEERRMSPIQYRQEVIWPTLALRALASEKLQVTDEEIAREIESEYGPRVSVRMISVSQEKTAKEVHKQAVADPKKFPELAKQFCEDPNVASVGGMIPPIRKNLGDKSFEDTAFALKAGQVSKILKVHDQYFILRCEGHTPSRPLSAKEAPAVKKALADRIRDNKLRFASTELFKQLQEDSKTETIYKTPDLAKRQPGVAAVLNGKTISMQALAEECLQRHGIDVLEGEINRKLLTQELDRRNQKLSQKEIDAEIDRAALSYGYTTPNGAPDRDKWLEQVETQEGASRDLYVKDAVWPSAALRKLAEPKVKVTADDLKKGFESNFGPRVEVLAIVLASQKEAQKVWEMARDGGTEAFFGDLAAEYSIEPVSKSNSGRVPPIKMHGGQTSLEDEAFKLKAGEISGIVALGDKFVVLRCLGRTTPTVTKMEDVKAELDADLRENKLNVAMSEEFETIRRGAQIDNYLTGTSQSPRTAQGKGPAKGAAPTKLK